MIVDSLHLERAHVIADAFKPEGTNKPHPSHFTLSQILAINEKLGYSISLSMAYIPDDRHSRKNPAIIEDMLRACVIDFGKGWERHLSLIEFSYNNSYHASIKAASYEHFMV
ncbi:reverse transcriptase domain-containing protein [Tanacetum coccineum]